MSLSAVHCVSVIVNVLDIGYYHYNYLCLGVLFVLVMYVRIPIISVFAHGNVATITSDLVSFKCSVFFHLNVLYSSFKCSVFFI